MLTPKPRAAVLSAVRARQHTLTRCRGGFSDVTATTTEIVTVRTANALTDMGLAVYDNPNIPLRLILTSAGIDEAARILAESAPARAA